MKYVFGPVPSRRLGQSLGIDPVPFKTCNWNCVYCQLGRTSPLTNERRDFFSTREIVAEVMAAVQAHARARSTGSRSRVQESRRCMPAWVP